MAPPAALDVAVEGVTDTTSVILLDPVKTKGIDHLPFGLEDVLPHRGRSGPMPAGVSAFGSSDMFKSPSCFKKPRARRWDHRINLESST